MLICGVNRVHWMYSPCVCNIQKGRSISSRAWRGWIKCLDQGGFEAEHDQPSSWRRPYKALVCQVLVWWMRQEHTIFILFLVFCLAPHTECSYCILVRACRLWDQCVQSSPAGNPPAWSPALGPLAPLLPTAWEEQRSISEEALKHIF